MALLCVGLHFLDRFVDFWLAGSIWSSVSLISGGGVDVCDGTYVGTSNSVGVDGCFDGALLLTMILLRPSVSFISGGGDVGDGTSVGIDISVADSSASHCQCSCSG